jgi:SAM-dependent methyltransferase
VIGKLRRLQRAGTLGLAVKGEIGDWVSTLGEKLGSDRLVYNAWTYAGFHRAALEAGPTMVAGILELLPGIRSAVDLGCGTGVYVRELLARGVDAQGFEYDGKARRIAREELGLEIAPFDLREFAGPGRRFDLAMSLEVAEHLPPELGDRLVAQCCSSAPRVVFSAAHPGQPGQGHINLQPREYWIERFRELGFAFDADKTAALQRYLRARLVRGFWLAENVGVYAS